MRAITYVALALCLSSAVAVAQPGSSGSKEGSPLGWKPMGETGWKPLGQTGYKPLGQ